MAALSMCNVPGRLEGITGDLIRLADGFREVPRSACAKTRRMNFFADLPSRAA